jgi:FkbM family methyltransferase
MNHETLVVIGAMDGVSHDSLFYKLKQMVDWFNIIFVEPVPYQFLKLVENTRYLRGTIYYECGAISNVKEDVVISYVNEKDLAFYDSYINGCSCVLEEGQPINRFMRDVKEEHRTYQLVRTMTFSELMTKYGIRQLDYLQVDAEGYDQRIIDSIDFNKYGIKEIKFERHYLDDDFIPRMMKRYKNYTARIDEGDIIFELK